MHSLLSRPWYVPPSLHPPWFDPPNNYSHKLWSFEWWGGYSWSIGKGSWPISKHYTRSSICAEARRKPTETRGQNVRVQSPRRDSNTMFTEYEVNEGRATPKISARYISRP
jgi:hypothetical protein